MFGYINAVMIYIFINNLNCIDSETTKELCLWEVFKPECASNEIVFINDARYGRMNVGKCLSKSDVEALGPQSQDPRSFGCYDDVTGFLNKRCYNEKQCEIRVADMEQLKHSSCIPGLKMYLLVEYVCLPVLHQADNCHLFLSSTPKYSTISTMQNMPCLSTGSQISIEVPKGQRVKLTYKAFDNNQLKERNDCKQELGLIFLKKNKTNITICETGFYNPSSQPGIKQSFLSEDNAMHVILYRLKHYENVLLEMKAEGCLDIIPPEDTWLKRTNDDIVIGCYSSKQTWYLRCENSQWTGVIGNCSNPDSFITKSEVNYENNEVVTNLKLNMSASHQTLIIISICGFGLVACLAIVCLGFVYLKKMKVMEAKKQGYTNGPNLYGNSTYGHVNRYPDNTGFNGQSLFPSTFNKPPHSDNGGIENERYQVLDKDEVAKECPAFA